MQASEPGLMPQGYAWPEFESAAAAIRFPSDS
jgi:hypothetical protein